MRFTLVAAALIASASAVPYGPWGCWQDGDCESSWTTWYSKHTSTTKVTVDPTSTTTCTTDPVVDPTGTSTVDATHTRRHHTRKPTSLTSTLKPTTTTASTRKPTSTQKTTTVKPVPTTAKTSTRKPTTTKSTTVKPVPTTTVKTSTRKPTTKPSTTTVKPAPTPSTTTILPTTTARPTSTKRTSTRKPTTAKTTTAKTSTAKTSTANPTSFPYPKPTPTQLTWTGQPVNSAGHSTTYKNPATATFEPQCTPAASSYIAAAVDGHNAKRAIHQANPVIWDDNLSCIAQRQAHSCIFNHLMYVNGGGYGQNLAGGTGTTITDSIGLWYNEAPQYQPYYGQSNPPFVAGHFTQLVWASTTSIGCATHTCDGSTGTFKGDITVCNYWVFGNLGGAYKENVLPAVN